MPSVLDASGLTIATRDELVTSITQGKRDIYGSDINVDSNSPDGQAIQLEVQGTRDILELLLGIYNNMDPDTAIGVAQDRLFAINDIQRQGPQFSYQDIQITVDRALTLDGLDAEANILGGTGYTVSDSLGNNWILVGTQSPVVAGTYTYNFRAENYGAISSLPNTITAPVSVVIGVTAINNATGVTTLGVNEESDSLFRIRRQQSTANRSVGFIDGLRGVLLNTTGVSDAVVRENFTGSVDADGTAAHTIWCIVEGGSNQDIAQAIYTRKDPGCGLRGTVTIDILTDQNSTFTASFDRPTAQNLFIKFDIKPTKTGITFDLAGIKTYLATNLSYTIGAAAESTAVLVEATNAIVDNGKYGVPLNAKVSNDGLVWVDYISPSSIDKKWSISTPNISITVI